MLSIKNGKNGAVYYKFEAELVELAKELFPKVAQIVFNAGSPQLGESLPEAKKVKTLEDVKHSVEGNSKPKLQLSLATPHTEKPDFAVYVKQCVKEETKQMLAFRLIYAEIYAKTNTNIKKETQKLSDIRKSKARGTKGDPIWKSDVVRMLGLNDLALEIAKDVVKRV